MAKEFDRSPYSVVDNSVLAGQFFLCTSKKSAMLDDTCRASGERMAK